MNSLIVFGTGGHARVVQDCAHANGIHDGGLVAREQGDTSTAPLHNWTTFIESAELVAELQQKQHACIIGIGHTQTRQAVATRYPDLHWATLTHPSAILLSQASVGDGTLVCAGALLGVACRIGKHCIINSCASIDHDCVLYNFAHAGPGARLCGDVVIEEAVCIGAGAIILPGLHIGAGAVIGAGSVVTKNVDPETVVYGNPARIHNT